MGCANNQVHNGRFKCGFFLGRHRNPNRYYNFSYRHGFGIHMYSRKTSEFIFPLYRNRRDLNLFNHTGISFFGIIALGLVEKNGYFTNIGQ